MQTIELEKVTSYRVKTTTGSVLMEHKSTWNGLIELVDAKGRKLIVSPEGGMLGLAMDDGLFRPIGFQLPRASVVMCSPELSAILVWQVELTGEG